MNTLTTGKLITGTITGVEPFGAFVDVGCNKDALLHKTEMAEATQHARDRLAVGETVRMFVKYIDAAGKVSLTARDPAVASRERAAREAEQAARVKERAAHEAERAAREAEKKAAAEAERAAHEAAATCLAEIEATMVADAEAREAAAAAAREAAGLRLSAASLLRGEILPPTAPAPTQREVLVRKMIEGREHVLYNLEWKDERVWVE